MSLVQPYAHLHADLNGPGDQRPTAEMVVRDQGLVGAWTGITVLITGCTSGIGIETARALYLTGANVYITARAIEKGNQVAAELSLDPARPVKVLQLELDSFQSIREAAEKFLRAEPKLNVLINNAGVMACPEGRPADGHELQFGTNHLGHFLLFQLLMPALLAAATPAFPSRVVSLSSTGHRYCTALPFEDLRFETTPYNPFVAYGRSKLANIHFANELDRRYGDRHLHASSLHPGSIKTPLQRHVENFEMYEKTMKDPAYQAQVKSVEQGAATTVWAAIGKEWAHRGGVYLENVGEASPSTPEGSMYRTGYSDAAFNPKDERRLWEESCRLCGLTDDAPL